MVEVMSKVQLVSVVTRKDEGWLLATTLPDVGVIHAFAETDAEIDVMVRQNVCSFTEFEPFDFDIHFEFPGDKPKSL